MITYTVRHPIVAARRNAQGCVVTEALPVGTLLTLAYGPLRRGLIEVFWNGEVVRVFADDLRSRAESTPQKDL
jgi:hypothetical protein